MRSSLLQYKLCTLEHLRMEDPALPWGRAKPEARDPMQDAAANLALLAAARVLTKHTTEDSREALDVVASALREMTPEGRLAAAARMRMAQEHIYGILKGLQAQEGVVTADDIRGAFTQG